MVLPHPILFNLAKAFGKVLQDMCAPIPSPSVSLHRSIGFKRIKSLVGNPLNKKS